MQKITGKTVTAGKLKDVLPVAAHLEFGVVYKCLFWHENEFENITSKS
jgi:hypothetical protein